MARASALLFLLLAPATARDAAAQNSPPTQQSVVTVSFGGGPIVTGYQLVELPRDVPGWAGTSLLVKVPVGLMGSIQVRTRRSLFLQGEVAHAAGRRSVAITNPEYSQAGRFTQVAADTTVVIDESLSQTSVVGNVLAPVDMALPRVTAFVAAGGGIRATATVQNTSFSCAPRLQGGCNGRRDLERHVRDTAFAPLLQVSYGIDVLVQPRLSGFTALRWPFEPASDDRDYNLTGFGMSAGVRFAFGGSIFEASNRRKGRRRPSFLRTVTMLGLVGGGIAGGMVSAGSSSDDLRSVAPPAMSLYGAGIGAAIGAALDAVR